MLLYVWLRTVSDRQDPVAREGDWFRVGPGELGQGQASAIELGDTDEECEAAGWGHQAGGDRQDGFKTLHGAKGDQVEGGAGQLFGATVSYIDVRQYEGPRDFA